MHSAPADENKPQSDALAIPSADDTLALADALNDNAPHPLARNLTDNARNLVDTMIAEGISAANAAVRIGLSSRTGLNLIGKPAVRAYLEARIEVARKGLAARSLAVVERALDKGSSEQASAAMLRAGLEAARFLNGEETRAGVNVQVNVQVPGYVIDLGGQAQVKPPLPQIEAQAVDITAQAGDDGTGNGR